MTIQDYVAQAKELRKDLEEIGYKDIDIYSNSIFEGRAWSFVKGHK